MKMGVFLLVPLLLQFVKSSPLTTSVENSRQVLHTTKNWTIPLNTLSALESNTLQRGPKTDSPNDVAVILTTMKEKMSQIEDDQKEIMKYLNQIETLLKLKSERHKSSGNSKPIVPYIKHSLHTSATFTNSQYSMSEIQLAENGYSSSAGRKSMNAERVNNRLFVQP